MRIGIIDIPFADKSGIEHVALYTIEGDPVEIDDVDLFSHGGRVCRILGERGAVAHRMGLLSDAEFIFIDVSHRLDRAKWDFRKIGPAIQILADEFDVDVINISGGAYLSGTEFGDPEIFLQQSVEYAFDKGVLIFAATGNDAKKDVAIPARYDSCIGVGAIGICNLAPEGTLYSLSEQAAKEIPGANGALPDGFEVFHFIDTCFGKGLDIVAPGVGIFMEVADEVVLEYEGTSYAVPIALAALAKAYCDIKNAEDIGVIDFTSVKEHLSRRCVGLLLDVERQGMGLPRIGV